MKRKAFLASCLSPLAFLGSSRSREDNTPEAPKSPEKAHNGPVMFSDNGGGIVGPFGTATFTNIGQKAGLVGGFRIEPGESLAFMGRSSLDYDAHGTWFLIRHQK